MNEEETGNRPDKSKAAPIPSPSDGATDSHPAGVGKSLLPPGRIAAWAICALVLLAVVLVFGQTVRHDFIRYFDDNEYLIDNPSLARGFTGQGLAWAFGHFHAGNWHPLTWLSHMLDCQLYGLNHPGGHHLTNLLLHAANAILLFLVLGRMTGDLWPSACVAMLFAIHPLHVESVAFVAERKDLLSGLFFMLTLAAYCGYARRPFSPLGYLLVTALFALGLMAKPMLVTLPFVLLLLDYWPLGRAGSGEQGAGKQPEKGRKGEREKGKTCNVRFEICDLKSSLPDSRSPLPAPCSSLLLLLEKLPWLVLAATSCVVTYRAQGAAVADVQLLPLPSRIANALVSCVAYLRQFFYPAGLAAFYPYPKDLSAGKIVGAFLLLACITLAVVIWRRKCPYLLVGWLWYLGMLVPVIGLVQVGSQAMADRYAYLTQIGIYIAVAWGAERVSRHWPSRRCLCGLASVLVATGLACCAWQQASYWKNDVALWRHALACMSANAFAHINLGAALADGGRVDEAIGHYLAALEISPNDEMAHNNLGAALAARGQFEEAIAQYREALRIKPDCEMAHNNLALALLGRGQVDEAITHFRETLRIRPDSAIVHYNLGLALLGRGQLEEAIAHFRKALEIKEDIAVAHHRLGLALAARGRDEEAIVHLERALEITPGDAQAHNDLGVLLARRGRVAEAIVQFQKSLDINPDQVHVRQNLEFMRGQRR